MTLSFGKRFFIASSSNGRGIDQKCKQTCIKSRYTTHSLAQISEFQRIACSVCGFVFSDKRIVRSKIDEFKSKIQNEYGENYWFPYTHTHTETYRCIKRIAIGTVAIHSCVCNRNWDPLCLATNSNSNQMLTFDLNSNFKGGTFFCSTFINDMPEFLTMSFISLLIFFYSICLLFEPECRVCVSQCFNTSSCVVYFDKAFRCGKQTMIVSVCLYLCVFALKTKVATNPKWVINRKKELGRGA